MYATKLSFPTLVVDKLITTLFDENMSQVFF